MVEESEPNLGLLINSIELKEKDKRIGNAAANVATVADGTVRQLESALRQNSLQELRMDLRGSMTSGVHEFSMDREESSAEPKSMMPNKYL